MRRSKAVGPPFPIKPIRHEKGNLFVLPPGAHPAQPRTGLHRATVVGRAPGGRCGAAGRLLARADPLAQGGANGHPAVPPVVLGRLPDGAHLSLWARPHRRRHVAQPRHHQFGRGGRTAVATVARHRVGGGDLHSHPHAGRRAVAPPKVGRRHVPAPPTPSGPCGHCCHGHGYRRPRALHPLCAHGRPVSAQCRV